MDRDIEGRYMLVNHLRWLADALADGRASATSWRTDSDIETVGSDRAGFVIKAPSGHQTLTVSYWAPSPVKRSDQ